MDAELRKQPTADKGAEDTNDNVTDDPKTSALYNLPGQPSGHETHQQYDHQTLARQMHCRVLQIHSIAVHLYATEVTPPTREKLFGIAHVRGGRRLFRRFATRPFRILGGYIAVAGQNRNSDSHNVAGCSPAA